MCISWLYKKYLVHSLEIAIICDQAASESSGEKRSLCAHQLPTSEYLKQNTLFTRLLHRWRKEYVDLQEATS